MLRDGKKALIYSSLNLKNESGTTIVYLISDDFEFVEDICTKISDIPIIVATSNNNIYEKMYKQGIRIKKLSSPLLFGINVISQIKDLLLSSCAEGILRKNDKVLCVVSTSLNIILTFDVIDIGITYLCNELKNGVDIHLLEILLNMSFELSQEGKEGNPVGALFVIGDTSNVMDKSHQLIINPFLGHKELSIKEEKNWKIFKEFALLDGAFIIDEKGFAVSAGRYISINWKEDSHTGFGGRHLAARYISKDTNAIAVTVSSTGVIRVFKNGEIFYKIGAT